MCGKCKGVGSTTLTALPVRTNRTAAQRVAEQPCSCPAGHPYFPQASVFCCGDAPFAFLSTTTGNYQCTSGATPVPGRSSIDPSKTGMICPGSPNVIANDPNAAAASIAANKSSNTMYYVIGGLFVAGLAGIMIVRSRQATPNRRRRHGRRRH